MITTLNYDGEGNLTEKKQGSDSTIYRYNGNDNLISVARNGTTLGRYSNDHLGLRIEKEAKDPLQPGAPPVKLRTLWDGRNAFQDRDSGGEVIARYDNDGRHPVGMWHRDDGSQALHRDALGSIVATTDGTGKLKSEIVYDAFGNITEATGQSANKFGYTGHQMDAETGLVYFQARYYDPQLGRFITQDPYEGDWKTPLSLHHYLYAYGNPTVYVDLNGYEATDRFVEQHRNDMENGRGAIYAPLQKPAVAVVAAMALGPLVVPVAAEVGAVAMATGRALVGIANAVRAHGVIGAAVVHPIEATVLAVEGAAVAGGVASGAPMPGITSAGRDAATRTAQAAKAEIQAAEKIAELESRTATVMAPSAPAMANAPQNARLTVEGKQLEVAATKATASRSAQPVTSSMKRENGIPDVSKSSKQLAVDAKEIHSMLKGERARNGATVATGEFDGELVYSVSNNRTSKAMRDKADELGYTRIFGKENTGPNQTDAEQILLNWAENNGKIGLEKAARIAPSRPACGPGRQDCGGRIDATPGVTLIGPRKGE
ncbi:hypothetical protein ASE26_29605 [Duganella sp. Root198D2]|nr:hypothetical protein ASE26_29605 [Duganella sp. Root198D2]